MNRAQALFRVIPAMFMCFAGAVAANGMHPDVPILDKDEVAVIESGLPMSTMTTCGGECHDTEYIAANSDHANAGADELGTGDTTYPWQAGQGYFGGWNPLSYDTDGLSASGEMDLQPWLK